jgi:23S rRNA pseudouridine2605 synthase
VAKNVRPEKGDSSIKGEPFRAGPPPKRSPKSAEGSKHSSEDGAQRLQRVLASAGFGSRRQCEELITEGRVEVDGLRVVELGTQVDPKVAKIFVDGTLLKKQRTVYFLLNKPPGVVTSNRDPQGRTRVIDLIDEPERVFPVGRLDRSSEGLLLLTNDGDLAQQLAHPKYGVRKIYRVTVAGKIDNDKLVQMRKGIYIAEGHVAVDGAKILRHRAKATDLEIVLREGKNREIRRILARLGHKVMSLQRVALGPLRLGDLPRGNYRALKTDELKRLREEVFYQSRAAKAGGESADEERPSGPRKKTKKKSNLKREIPGAATVSKIPGAGKPGAKKFTDDKSRMTKQTEGILADSKRVGTVIGDDPIPELPAKTDKRDAGKKRAGKKVVRDPSLIIKPRPKGRNKAAEEKLQSPKSVDRKRSVRKRSTKKRTGGNGT